MAPEGASARGEETAALQNCCTPVERGPAGSERRVLQRPKEPPPVHAPGQASRAHLNPLNRWRASGAAARRVEARMAPGRVAQDPPRSTFRGSGTSDGKSPAVHSQTSPIIP